MTAGSPAPRAIADIFPLTPMQQGILFHALGAPDEPLYRQQDVLHVGGVAGEDVLRQALEDLVARHAALRTGFVPEAEGRPLQVVFGRASLPFASEDLRRAGEAERERRLAQVRADELAKPFDVRRPPLLRVCALRVGADCWRLVATHHHVVVDGWSVSVLYADLAELLAARMGGRPPCLQPARPFRDHVRWLEGRSQDDQRYFSELLAGVERPTPLGVDRAGRVSGAIDWAEVVALHPTPPEAHPERLARQRGLLTSAVVHAAWGLLLARCAGTADAVFGMTVSGRPAELGGAATRVGMFVNTIPVRVRAADGDRVADWLGEVQGQLLRSREHEHAPLAVAQRGSRVPPGRPLFETVLAFQNYWRPGQDVRRTPEGVTVEVIHREERTSVPVAVAVALPPRGVWVRLDYDRRRLDAVAAEQLARRYARLVAAVAAADGSSRLAGLPLLEPREARLPEPRTGGLELGLTATDRVVVALLPGDPAYAGVVAAARSAGAGLDVRDPLVPGPGGGATVVVGPPAAVRAMTAGGGTPARAVVAGEPPPPALVEALTGRGCAVLRLVAGHAPAVDDPYLTTCLGRVPGGYVADPAGRRVLDGASGELVVREAGRDVRTGVWARALADGSLEELGRGPRDESVWIERALARDRAVSEAAVVADPGRGPVAWLVPADPAALDLDGLLDRLRREVPAELLPVAFEVVPALPLTAGGAVDRALLACPPVPPPPRPLPAPLAGRLALMPSGRRADFLARLRDAGTAAPESLDARLEHWRRALAGAPLSHVPADRVLPGAAGQGTVTVTVPVPSPSGGEGAEWLAAVAAALALAGRDDDVVLGVLDGPRMLPVRVAPVAGRGLGALAGAVAVALDAARRHADVPWPRLRELLAEEPLVGVALHPVPGTPAAHAGAAIGLDIGPGEITAVFDRARFLPETVSALCGRIVEILGWGLEDPDRPVGAAGLVSGPERERLLGWGRGGASADAPATLHGLVADRARAAPEAVAVVGPDGTLSYGGLVARASALARLLRANGAGCDDRVVLCVPRTTDAVCAALGVLMAGAAYVPVDPRHPDARLALLCADAGAGVAVTAAAWRERFAGVRAVIAMEDVPDGAPPPERAGPASAAYVIYTSGSTGTPKGVVVEHRQAVDFCRHIAAAYRMEPGCRVLGFAALTFDVSVFDVWATLTSGATLVLAGDEERLAVDRLQRLLEERRVTLAELPPILMPQLDPRRLPDLRLVSVGGEAPPGILVDTWASGEREFWNGYGPAETTVAVTLMRCLPPAGRWSPPIGRPMVNHRAYVLDERLRLAPVGAPGELCIAGAGVARGYLGRPGLTAERFVPDPFAGAPGERMCRTGDLARWAPDGLLEFLGRVDRQVKIRGVRVEPGEVEVLLAADPRIRQVVVDACYDEGVRHLAAYVVAADPSRRFTLADVREIVGARLPDALVPTRLAVLDRLPVTQSGKVDRRALPVPGRPGDEAAIEPDAGWSDAERTIAGEVIAPLLGVPGVGRRDSFFHLGGNSLQATQVTSRMRDRFGVEVSLTDFFADPTVARLARMIDEARRRAADEEAELYGRPAAAPMRPGDRLPLAYPQVALWRAERSAGPNAAHHVPLALRLRGRLDVDAVRGAFRALVARHAALRVAFEERGGEPVQRVLDPGPVPFELTDVPDGAVGRLVREEGARPFDLGSGPPVRLRVLRLAPDDHVVQWTVHHLVTDAWSVGVQLSEFGRAYRALAAGAEPRFAPLPATYADFVAWQRGHVASPAFRDEVGWWRERLAGAPPSLGLTAGPPGDDRGFAGGWRNVRLGDDVTRGALALAQWSGATPYMVMVAAYAVVLAAAAGSDDVLVVSPIAGRLRSEWEPVAGFFVNRVVVRVRVGDGATTFRELLQRVRAASVDAFAHQTVPFELLLAELDLPPSAVAANFMVQNAPLRDAGGALAGLEVEVVDDDTGRDFAPLLEVYSPLGARFQVSLVLRQRPDGIRGGMEYDARLIDDARAAHLAEGFTALLARVSEDPAVGVRELLDAVK